MFKYFLFKRDLQNKFYLYYIITKFFYPNAQNLEENMVEGATNIL